MGDLSKARNPTLDILNHPIHSSDGPLGMTEGGFHRDKDGTKWYAKFHDSPEHAYTEHLANQVYRALGHAAPKSHLLHQADGKPVYFSKEIPDFKTLHEHSKLPPHQWYGNHWADGRVSKEGARNFLKGLAADSLVGATDIHSSNIGFRTTPSAAHTPFRIDNGGTLLYHANGAKHTWDHGSIDSAPSDFLRGGNPHDVHRYAAAYADFREAGHPAVMRQEVKKISALRSIQPGGRWSGFVEKHVPHAPQEFKSEVSRCLELRTRDLMHHVTHGAP